MRRRGKTDLNQTEIVDALRRCGYLVQSLAAMGDGVPDLLVYRRDCGLRLLEVKGSQGKLTPDQIEFKAKGWPVEVARTAEEAIKRPEGVA